MPRPMFIEEPDLSRWDKKIDSDPLIPKQFAQNPIIREVCYCGQYLAEQLIMLECPDHLISRILYTAGQLSFGQPDPWEIHLNILRDYENGKLEFELEPDELN